MTQRLGAAQDDNGVHSPEGGVRAAARSTARAQSAPQSGQRSQGSEPRPVQVADIEDSLRMLGLTVADVGAPRLPPASVSELEAALKDCGAGEGEPDFKAAVATALRGLLGWRSLQPPELKSVIDGVSGTPRWRLGVAVFKAMAGLPVRHCRGCANSALLACSHGHDARAAWEVYSLMNRPGKLPDSTTYSILIPLTLDNGDVGKSVECFTDAVHRYCDLDAATCMCLLAALQREGQWREAEAALVCTLPSAPFQALAEDLYWPPDPHATHSTPSLRRLQQESLRYVDCTAGARQREPETPPAVSETPRHSGSLDTAPRGVHLAFPSASVSDAGTFSDSGPDTSTNGDSPPRLVEHVPLYLLGTAEAGEACGIVLEMYCAATPPQAARGRTLVSAMSRAHVQGLVPAPHDSAYQLLLDAHISLGSRPEAWALLHFLAHVAWQPPDASLLSLLATARGAELRSVPQAWRAFTLRGVLPSGVCCNCFITEAAAASTTGSDTDWADPADRAYAIAESGSAGARARMAWEATAMKSALSRRHAPAGSNRRAIFQRLVQAGVGLSWRTLADCCGEREQLQCCRARLPGCAAKGPRQHCC